MKAKLDEVRVFYIWF